MLRCKDKVVVVVATNATRLRAGRRPRPDVVSTMSGVASLPSPLSLNKAGLALFGLSHLPRTVCPLAHGGLAGLARGTAAASLRRAGLAGLARADGHSPSLRSAGLAGLALAPPLNRAPLCARRPRRPWSEALTRAVDVSLQSAGFAGLALAAGPQPGAALCTAASPALKGAAARLRRLPPERRSRRPRSA